MTIQFEKMFQAVDRSDTTEFLTHLDDDISFVFANMPPVKGKQALATFLNGFFSSIECSRHYDLEQFTAPNAITVTGKVEYTRKDGKKLTFPFCNLFKLKGNKVKDYLIYVDNHTLFE